MATKRVDEREVARSQERTWNFTTYTFIKRELPLHEGSINRLTGKPGGEPFSAERFQTEAAALKLIYEQTSIPVPRLESCGKGQEDGLWFLETELIHGIPGDRAGDECRMKTVHYPDGQYTGGECSQCTELARTNMNRFVNETLLPELSKLRSSCTGLSGLVIPPRWILAVDQRPSWEPKKSTTDEYYMTHGDLAYHNIMLSFDKLEIVSVLDWEYSGYFPPGFQKWSNSRKELSALSDEQNEGLARQLVATIEP